MAQTTGIIASYQEVGTKEDISEIITNISPTKTPFQTMIGNWPVFNTYYQWQEDQLLSPAQNAQIEGSTATAAISQPTVLRYNNTQILEKVAQTADTLDALKFYGRDRELAYQLAMRSAELKRDLEYAYVGSGATSTATGFTTNSPISAGGNGGGTNTGSARIMAGYQQMIGLTASGSYNPPVVFNGVGTTAALIAGVYSSGTTAATLVSLTEAMVLETAQVLFQNGIDPEVLMVKPNDSLKVAAFAQGSGSSFGTANTAGYIGPIARTLYTQNGEKQVVNVVNVYVSPFGDLKQVINRFQRTADAFVFTPDMWKKAVLRNWTRVNLAKTGDFTQTMIVGEYGLQHRNFFASGLITGLA
jgi:hypothetical protein